MVHLGLSQHVLKQAGPAGELTADDNSPIHADDAGDVRLDVCTWNEQVGLGRFSKKGLVADTDEEGHRRVAEDVYT